MPDEGNKPRDPKLFFFFFGCFIFCFALRTLLALVEVLRAKQGTGKIIVHKLLDVSSS